MPLGVAQSKGLQLRRIFLIKWRLSKLVSLFFNLKTWL